MMGLEPIFLMDSELSALKTTSSGLAHRFMSVGIKFAFVFVNSWLAIRSADLSPMNDNLTPRRSVARCRAWCGASTVAVFVVFV